MNNTIIPEWANFVAIDKNNIMFYYQYEPRLQSTYWMGARLMKVGHVKPWPCGDESWKKTKAELRQDIPQKFYMEKPDGLLTRFVPNITD